VTLEAAYELWTPAQRRAHRRAEDIGSALVAGGLGLAILVGGPVRFSGPSLTGARELAPWWAWGLAVAAAGLALAAGTALERRALLLAGYVMAATWGLFFAGGVLAAAVLSPQAILTGAVIYLAYARVMVVRARRVRLRR
jgi:hypothetical protein